MHFLYTTELTILLCWSCIFSYGVNVSTFSDVYYKDLVMAIALPMMVLVVVILVTCMTEVN